MGVDVLEFGDRSGSWVALAFFSAIFLLLAIAVWREIRRRAPGLTRVAAAVAVLLFAVPVAAGVAIEQEMPGCQISHLRTPYVWPCPRGGWSRACWHCWRTPASRWR